MPDRADQPSPFLVAEDIEALPPAFRGAVVAIGNFDGMHIGHRRLLEATLSEARRRSAPAVAITFEPHPRTVLQPDPPVFRLTPVSVKEAVLRVLGFTGAIVIPFDRTFAGRSAEFFVQDILQARLGVRGVVVGYDFHFGKSRQGTPAFLAEAGNRLGFAVTLMPKVADADGVPYASYRIRAALEAGEIDTANALLGYRWLVRGEVVHGARRGRDLGFPTANIELAADCRLRHGIYAVRLRRAEGSVHDAVASFGRRPTFGDGPPLLEVFVFDFEANLYGETVEVSFFDWIRPELRFDSVGELTERMRQDVAESRAILLRAGPGSELDLLLAVRG